MIGMPIRANSDENDTQSIILIDPGHGGIDGGAKSKNGTIEKNINLLIATKLKKELENSGYIVYMTREEDSQLDSKKVKDLNARCQMKKDTKICFHKQAVLELKLGMHLMIIVNF
jgi:N-acetylmuramoyl-L-alanine amidase